VLSQIPGAKEDGYFTLDEIMNCNYNAKMAICLSLVPLFLQIVAIGGF